MKNRTKTILFSAVLVIHLFSPAQGSLKKRIDSIVNRPSQRKTHFAIHITDADNEKTLCARNAKEPMIPASNMKIITTAAAVKFLGPDYVYQTQVGISGDILKVKGSGDPLFGDKVTDAKYGRNFGWVLDDITRTLKQNNVNMIKGIVVDTTVFDDHRVHPNWPAKDLNRWYACEVCGLNYNANCVDITAKNSNGTVSVIVEPQTSFIKIINQVVPIQQGRSVAGCYRNNELNKIIVKGRCKKQVGPFAIAIERPAAMFAFLLSEHMIHEGISVQGQVVEKEIEIDEDFRFLTSYKSRLVDCLTRCNKDSFGLAAEALLKTIAAKEQQNKNGGWERAQELVSQYLMELGIDENQFFVDDGSGLSRQNKLSPWAITKVISSVYKSRNWQIYKDSMAVGGIDGTISKYFKEPKYKGKILGKTGYISDVKSFSGICLTDKGNYIFSILTSGTNGQTRRAINDIAKAIVDWAEATN